MHRIFSQPNTRFCKINHTAYAAIAHTDADIPAFCRNFFLALMDRHNKIVFECDVVSAIHVLTDWNKIVIQRNIRKLADRGELVRIGNKQIQYNPLFANRVIVFDQTYLGYKGKFSEYSTSELSIIDEINRLIRHENTHMEKETEMNELKKKIDDQTKEIVDIKKMMQELITFIKQDDLPKAKTFLTLIEGGKQD